MLLFPTSYLFLSTLFYLSLIDATNDFIIWTLIRNITRVAHVALCIQLIPCSEHFKYLTINIYIPTFDAKWRRCCSILNRFWISVIQTYDYTMKWINLVLLNKNSFSIIYIIKFPSSLIVLSQNSRFGTGLLCPMLSTLLNIFSLRWIQASLDVHVGHWNMTSDSLYNLTNSWKITTG